MGWNGSNVRHAPETPSLTRDGERPARHRSPWPFPKWKVVGGVIAILVILVGGISFFLRSNERQVALPQKKQLKSRPIAASAPLATNRTVMAEAKTEVPTKPADDYAARFPGEKILSVATNASGYVQVEAIKKDGGRILHVVTPPQIFKHPTDDMILAVLNVPDRQQMPPLPPGLTGARADLKFMESLKDPIVVNPEDSDRVRAYKEIVSSAREEIAERMKSGEHFADIIADQYKLGNENAKIKSNATRELNELIRNGDAEGARRYFIAINAAFEQMGIKPLKLNEKSNNPVIQEVLK